MSVKTVLGEIHPDKLGVTLPHEHLCVSMSRKHEPDTSDAYWKKPEDPEKLRIALAPVTLEILGDIRREICLNLDNLYVDSFDNAVSELTKYKMSGGSSIVEVSTYTKGRESLDLDLFRKISSLTKVNVIRSVGWYLNTTHPVLVNKASIDDLSKIMVKELTEEIGQTGIKAGVIGELGCSAPLHPDEKKVLLAGAKAQEKTGAPLTVHVPHFDYTSKKHVREADKYVGILEEGGGALEKVYLSHMDTPDVLQQLDYQRRIMDKGVTLSYDRFGLESIYDDWIFPGAREIPTDSERITAIVQFCKQGYDKNLMLSHDNCMKIQFTKWGGFGDAHILNHIVPSLKHEGVTDNQVKNMLIDNPKRIFSW